MVSQGYLLAEDLKLVLDQASQHFDQLSSRVAEALPQVDGSPENL